MKRKLLAGVLLLLLSTSFISGQTPMNSEKDVKIWEESISMPTYLVDPQSTNPRFYDGRSYQGAQGRMGAYDHGKEAGTVIVSNHNIAPGKKFWTWSNGSRGKLWDKALTDTDGPALELLVGGYSDNQPDYSWLQPNEAKCLKQYWYPIRGIGGVKNANIEAAVKL